MKRILNFFKKTKKKNAGRDREISDMLLGIQKLSERTARDVMVPRVDMLAVDKGSDTIDLFNFVAHSSHSRFPVYKDTVDNIIGILYVKDLLKVAKNIEEVDIATLLRHPFFVPETMALDMLLHEMKKKRVHIAIVVDEYGGVSGIVCLEDIIEEIVGEILDEFDNETEEFLKIGNNIYLIDARFPIEKFNERLSLSLPEEDYDTMGGFVYDLFGKIPTCYEKVSDKSFGKSSGKYIDYIIQTMDGNKIKSIKVMIREKDDKK